jgi:hypothetical protein
MYCDNAAARKPCLSVSLGMIFLVERSLNSRSQVSLSPTENKRLRKALASPTSL